MDKTTAIKEYQKASQELNLILNKEIIDNMERMGISEFVIDGICGVTDDVIYAGDCYDTITKITSSGTAYTTPNGGREKETSHGSIAALPTDSLIKLADLVRRKAEKKKDTTVKDTFKGIIIEGLQGLHVEDDVIDQLSIVLAQNPEEVIKKIQNVCMHKANPN